jgi:hypothetical protein
MSEAKELAEKWIRDSVSDPDFMGINEMVWDSDEGSDYEVDKLTHEVDGLIRSAKITVEWCE